MQIFGRLGFEILHFNLLTFIVTKLTKPKDLLENTGFITEFSLREKGFSHRKTLLMQLKCEYGRFKT